MQEAMGWGRLLRKGRQAIQSTQLNPTSFFPPNLLESRDVDIPERLASWLASSYPGINTLVENKSHFGGI